MPRPDLIRVPLESDLTPQQALLALRDDTRPFALTGRWAGGGAIVGSDPIRLEDDHPDPLGLLGETHLPDDARSATDGEVGGGWFGHLGYGVAATVEDVPPPPPRPIGLPRASFGFYDHVLRLDPGARWWFEGIDDGTNAERLQARLGVLRDRLSSAALVPAAFACGDFAARPGEAGYRRAVETCLGYIGAGDLYQANLALRLEADIEGAGLDLFVVASAALEPAYGAYFGLDGSEIVSLSPELFLRRRGRDVLTAPIKGTRRRTADPAAAQAASLELSESEKDQAENVMIVDLMRNDLGRVCDYGSVEARVASVPEAHPGLWHLVSEVEGRLHLGLGDAELLRATFPPGSVTGAPKIKAEEVISTLEGTGRECYTGAIGFCGPFAGLELNVAIRTFEISAGRVWLGVGAGIVADSDPGAEYAETIAKAEPLIAAVGAAIAPEARVAGLAPGPPPVRVRRPDPAAGLLETLLVVDGTPMEAEGHAGRMAESAAAVYGVAFDAAMIREAIDRVAPAAGRHRIRVSLVPWPDGLDLSTETLPVREASPATRVKLVPTTVPGGLGRHKWVDRRLVYSVAAEAGHEALICDIDGTVLESGAGNIWIVESGTLVTPPTDGRILPGATRAALLEVADALGIPSLEDHLTLERLASAGDLFVTSSVRGAWGAVLASGGPPGAPGEIRCALSEGLASRWTPPE